jgi:phosphoserine phosphatase
LRHQALSLEFKFNPDQLGAIIPDRVLDLEHIQSEGRLFSLPQVKGQIVRAYEKIFGRALAEVRDSAALADFSAGLLALNRAFEETPGIGCEFSYLWTVNFLQGFRPAEVRRLAAEVIRHELQSRLENRTWSDSRQRLRFGWRAGIRLFPEMADLSRALNRAGCRVIVSTASNPLVIEAMIPLAGFSAEIVLGQASGTARGRLLGTLAPGLRSNYGKGKVENWLRGLDREPALAAGDSPGDYEMLTAFPATRLKLLIRRPRPEKMAALYRRALGGDPHFLVQDVDRRQGEFASGKNSPVKE